MQFWALQSSQALFALFCVRSRCAAAHGQLRCCGTEAMPGSPKPRRLEGEGSSVGCFLGTDSLLTETLTRLACSRCTRDCCCCCCESEKVRDNCPNFSKTAASRLRRQLLGGAGKASAMTLVRVAQPPSSTQHTTLPSSGNFRMQHFLNARHICPTTNMNTKHFLNTFCCFDDFSQFH